MSEFDFDRIIQKRLQGELNPEASGFGSLNPEKFAELDASKAPKIQALRDSASRLKAQAKVNENSLVSTLGLDPNGVPGQVVNLGASMYSGASRVAGDLVGLAVGDIPAMARSLSLSEDEISAIGRHKQGIATLEDLAIINRQKSVGALTPLQMFDEATKDRQRSADVNQAFDRSDVVHQDNRAALSEQLGENFQGAWDQTKAGAKALFGGDFAGSKDLASGLAKLVYNAGEAALTNPAAASEYIAENLPQLAIGAFGAPGRAALLASNAGYASEQYQKGIAKYQAENQGAYPPEAERQKMAAYAASLALAEQVMDTSLLKGAQGAAEAAKATAKTGLVQSLKNIGSVTAKGTAGEAVTEGYQTFAEGEVNGEDVTAKDIYEGAVIGGIAGGGLSGGGRAAGELLKATPEHEAERKEQDALQKTRKEAQEAAINTGDVTALVDPKSKAYDPAKAIAALYGNSSLPEATDESRQANLTKATEIVAALETEREQVQSAYDSSTPEGMTKLREQLVEAKKEGNAEKVGLIESLLVEDPEESKKLKLQLSKLDRRLEQARNSLNQFSTGLAARTAQDIDVEAQVEALNAAIDTKDSAAVASRQKEAETLINLSMSVPERLSSSAAKALADNTDNGLTEPQRQYLRSFSDARIAENQLKGMGQVSQEIYTGGNGNVGIAQYRERVATALAAGNKAQAQQNLTNLRKFEADHKAKAAVVAQAWDQGRGTQIGKPAGSPWIVLPTPITRAKLKTIKGLEVNTPVLVTDTKTEADAITAALVELESAYDLKFPSRITGEKHVSHVSKAHRKTEDQSAEKQAKEAVGSVAASASGSVSDSSGSPSQVEATRVEKVDAGVSDASVTEHSEDNTQSTKKTVDDAAASSPESAEQTPQVSGVLDVLGNKSDEGTAYNLRNLIADYFTQTASREGDTTKRPLASVKDFFTTAWDKVAEYLPFDTQTDEQKQLLKFFQSTAAEWFPNIQSNLARRKEEFYFEDLIQFFMTEDQNKLDLEENVKTAMVYAAMSWVAENATRSPANNDAEINAILGREEDHRVSEEERRELLYVGTRQNVVSNALGQRAVQALGLKANKDAPVDLMPKLESSLGAHIFKMLMDQGLLMRQERSPEVMAQLTGSSATSDKAVHQFLRLARDKDNKLHPKAEEIFQKSMSTQGVLDKLFSVEPGLKEPSPTPVPFTQMKTRNTNQDVPKKLAKIIDTANAGASYVRQEMYDLIQHLDEDIALAMAGFEEADSTTTHKANLAGKQAKNDGLVRELTNIKQYVAGMLKQNADLEQPMYFEHSVWKQQRVGIATNMVNPQSSKIHRHMLFRKSWETEVDRNDAEQMDNFYLRVAEGLGIKTDKMSKEKALEEYRKAVANPFIQDSVKLLQKRLAGADLSRSEQESLRQGVQTGKEKFHTLSSLMALAQEAMAKEAEQGTFTVRLMGEVDGVTNGPMLSHLLLGAANTVSDLFGLLNRGGFFEQGNEHNQYNLWRGAAGHFDLYETTAGHMVQDIQSLITNGIKTKWVKMTPATVDQVMRVVYGFTGTLAEKDGKVTKYGRNIIKTPLTAMVFGSSVGSAVDSMADGFVESIYAAIEDTAKREVGSQTSAQLVENINVLLSQGNGPMLKPGMTTEQLMDHVFSKNQIEALKKTFTITVGAAVASTMEKDFATFIQRRKQLNKAAQTTHAIYNSVYTALREEMITELITAGEIAVNAKTGKPIHDLNQAQENELRKRLEKMTPLVHTAMSKGGSLKAGLYIAKTARKLSEKGTFEGNAKFATPFADNGAKSTKTRGFEVVESGPGVAMAPMMVHGLDSAISHTAVGDTEVLNVHDAHGTGLGGFIKTAQNLNRATWEQVLNYSPAAEMQAALSRTVVELASLIKEDKLPESAMTNLVKELTKLAGEDYDPDEMVSLMMAGMKEAAYQADDMKLQALAQMQSIDQYALEGGNYVVTEKDRADASALRAGLSRDLSAKEKEAIEVIENALNGEKVETTSSPVDRPMEEDAPAVVAQSSPFGAVGTPAIASDPELVAWFQENPDAPASDVVKHLYTVLKGGKGRVNDFNLMLLRKLNQVVNPDMMVRLVTPETNEESLLAKPNGPSRAWYVALGSSDAIYVLSPEFKNSGLTVETLLHELLHSAVSNIVDNELKSEKKDSKYRSEALELVQELDELREKAAAYTKQQGITGFSAALADVQEFIAWGMTNQEFQRQVINQISLKTKTSGNELINGFKVFIDKLVGILFKGSTRSQQEIAVNGMTVLISNVSGLLNEADQAAGSTTDANINLSQATDPVGTLNTYSTLDIHEALNAGDVTPEFDVQLRNLLGGIVEKLHGPFGALKVALMQNQVLNPVDTWLKAIDTGVAPFAASVQASPMVASAQEMHAMEQVEATVAAALDRNEVTSKSVYRELKKLYEEASRFLKPSDFASQDEYDFIFKIELDANGKSNHLARFAAFGLAHQEFNKKLQRATAVDLRKAGKAKTFAEKLQIIFEQILEFFHGSVTSTFGGQPADLKLASLVEQLVDIEAKKRMVLARQSTGFNPMSKLEGYTKSGTEMAKSGVVKALSSAFVRNNTNAFVRGSGALLRVVANDQVDIFMDGIKKIRDKHIAGKHGLMMGLLADVQGPGKTLNALSLMSTSQQRERRTVISQTAGFVLKAFSNEGNDLNKAAKNAISQVFLRTGLHSLLGDYNMSEITNLVSDRQARDLAIKTLEAKLDGAEIGNALKEHFINKANYLAYFKVTGINRDPVLMMSAHNIARLYGTAYRGRMSEAKVALVEPVIEQLVALYALGYVDGKDLDNAKEVLRTENLRTDGNGVEFTLALHKRLESESQQRLFRGQKALMVHGYTPEIYNPNTEVNTATKAGGVELENAGYKLVGPAELDPADPDREMKYIYVLKDGGLMPYRSGVISFTGKSAKGTKAHSGYMNINTADGLENASKHNDINQKKPRGLASGLRPDLSKKHGIYMAPVLNAAGEVVNWRYLMQDKTKNSVLERDNRFDKIMGMLAGSIYDKETSTEVNVKALEAMKEAYEATRATEPGAFLLISPKSPDAELRELWSMLPDDTRAAARSIFGTDGIYVRKDALTALFGYRKQSLADVFKKDPDARNAVEKLFVFVMQTAMTTYARVEKPGITADEAETYAKRAVVAVAQGERVWQELVHEVKDIIVVKSGIVLLGNVWSNLSLLLIAGVPFTNILKDHLVALRGATAYHDDSERLAELQAQIDTGVTNGKDAEILREITRLKDSLERNPVKELIDAGLMPTIAEDVVSEDDIYSYKGALVRKADEYTAKLNPTVLNVGKQVFMTHDTKMYQGLRRLTQLSDFVARYSLYQHLTNRKVNPLSKEDAIFEASDSFVNYDIPMYKGMQYLDDMGVTMFTKYFLRIQRVLLRTFKDNPARVLMTIALQNYMDLGPIVLDSGWMHKVGNNPLSWGAFQLPRTIDDLATVSAAMSIVK